MCYKRFRNQDEPVLAPKSYEWPRLSSSLTLTDCLCHISGELGECAAAGEQSAVEEFEGARRTSLAAFCQAAAPAGCSAGFITSQWKQSCQLCRSRCPPHSWYVQIVRVSIELPLPTLCLFLVPSNLSFTLVPLIS